ncbi:MAG TPA: hypothetical protein VFR67_14240 [Pilimelia sp.]|nr:hypothetical protein [Pilimelia sp.]
METNVPQPEHPYELTYAPHISVYDSPERKAERAPVTTTYATRRELDAALDAHGIPRRLWGRGHYRFRGDVWSWGLTAREVQDRIEAGYYARTLDDVHAEALAENAQRDAAADVEPQFPIGTPEYDAYAAELRGELRKWANGEPPYPYQASVMAPDLDDPTPAAEPPCCGGAGIVDLGSVSVPCPEPACGWCICGKYVAADAPAHTCEWSTVSAR